MSEECFLFGAIMAWSVRPDQSGWLDEFNGDAIARLPKDPDWPVLIPSMFAFEKAAGNAQTRYRQQVIHFGASYNHMSDGWPKFLEKFEGLLRRMAWSEVHLILNVERWGEHHFLWKSAKGATFDPVSGRPAAVTEWTFSGGPRRLDPSGGPSEAEHG